jgi:F-type H+-transporting ATPase subunit delta
MNTELQGIASSYAEAVLDLSSKNAQEEKVLDELKMVNAVFASDKDMSIIINHPAIRANQKKEILRTVFSGKVSELTDNLINLLADKRRLDLLPFIESRLPRTAQQAQKRC